MKVIMEEIGPSRDEGASTSKENSKKGKCLNNPDKSVIFNPKFICDSYPVCVFPDNNFNQNNLNNIIVDTKSGDSIEWILDVTIAYPDRIPLHLQDIVCGTRPPCAINLHYRLYPSNEVRTQI